MTRRSNLWLAAAVLCLSAGSMQGFTQATTSSQSGATTQPPAAADQGDLNSAIESLRADIRASKTDIISNTMNFTKDESDKFWPIYKRYQADMAKVNDERVSVIKEYAQKYETLTDADATDLAKRMLDFEQHRVDTDKKYFKEFSKALPGLTVAKFFQLERRLDLVVNLELAAHLPTLLAGGAK